MLLNAAQEQNRELEARLQKVISEANQEIQLLQAREAELQATVRDMQKVNADLRKVRAYSSFRADTQILTPRMPTTNPAGIDAPSPKSLICFSP